MVDRIDETDVIPSHEQAIRIRKAYEDDDISYDKVSAIMAEEKPNQKPKYKLSFEKLKPLIPKETKSAEKPYMDKRENEIVDGEREDGETVPQRHNARDER